MANDSTWDLKAKDVETLKAIDYHIRMFAYAPTVRKLSSLLGLFGTSAVHVRLHRLEDQGLIEVERRRSSGVMIGYQIRITRAGQRVLRMARNAEAPHA